MRGALSQAGDEEGSLFFFKRPTYQVPQGSLPICWRFLAPWLSHLAREDRRELLGAGDCPSISPSGGPEQGNSLAVQVQLRRGWQRPLGGILQDKPPPGRQLVPPPLSPSSCPFSTRDGQRSPKQPRGTDPSPAQFGPAHGNPDPGRANPGFFVFIQVAGRERRPSAKSWQWAQTDCRKVNSVGEFRGICEVAECGRSQTWRQRVREFLFSFQKDAFGVGEGRMTHH